MYMPIAMIVMFYQIVMAPCHLFFRRLILLPHGSKSKISRPFFTSFF